MKQRIYLSPPHLEGSELEAVKNVFRSNWIAPIGDEIDGFEADIENYLNENSNVTVLNSGTSAIHLALQLLDITYGDTVICQSNTFVATANPVLYQNATPVFVDSEPETWNMCPEQLKKAILSGKKKPKAIIAVHLYGMPYKVEEIHQIANTYQIPVIEDSAEALGSSYKNRMCGTFGEFAILSFNGNKIITTSTGGALISKNKTLKQKVIFLASQAKDKAIAYTHSQIGYNYRMSNVLAAIGRSQIKTLDDYVKKRRSNFKFYYNQFKDIDAIKFQEEATYSHSNRWLSCVLFPNRIIRDEIQSTLEKENIESRLLWKPMHMQPLFKDATTFANGISEDLFNRGLCLPSGSSLSTDDLFRISNCITHYFN